MRGLVGWMLIAFALAVSAGCASQMAGPATPIAKEDIQIWDCGWRSL